MSGITPTFRVNERGESVVNYYSHRTRKRVTEYPDAVPPVEYVRWSMADRARLESLASEGAAQ